MRSERLLVCTRAACASRSAALLLLRSAFLPSLSALRSQILLSRNECYVCEVRGEVERGEQTNHGKQGAWPSLRSDLDEQGTKCSCRSIRPLHGALKLAVLCYLGTHVISAICAVHILFRKAHCHCEHMLLQGQIGYK